MSRLAKIVAGVANIAGKDLGAYDRILMQGLYGQDSGESVLNSTYTKVDLVFSCISYTAKAIAQVPLLVMRKGKEGKYDPVSETDPWQQLVDLPNYMTSKVQFVTSILSFLLLDGCVAIIPFPPAFASNPDSLWVVPWKFCGYELDKNGHLLKWIYKPKGQEGPSYDLKPDQLFQLKFWNPDNPMEGLAPITAGRLPVLELYKSSDYNQRFFDQGAIPGGVLSTPQRLKQFDVDLVLAQFKEKHQGHMKRWEPAVLHQDLKWQSTGLSQRDMDFVNLRTKSSESIMQIFGMKKVILGITESLNYATGREQRKEWWAGTCLPLMRLISDTLSYGLFRQQKGKVGSYRIQFDISAVEALHEDYSSKIKTSEAMFRMGIPMDEINQMLELGLDPKPWYTLAYVPSQMMCVNYEDVGRENPNEPSKPEGDEGDEGDEGGEPGQQPTNPDEPTTINDAKGEVKGINQLIEHFNTAQEHQVTRFIDENLLTHIKEPVKSMVNRLRKETFIIRSKVLTNMLSDGVGTIDEAIAKVEDLSLNNEKQLMLKGVIDSWGNIFDVVDRAINYDENSLSVPKEKVDMSDSHATKTLWLTEFFTDLQKFVDNKKHSVLNILKGSESVEQAVVQVKVMFNRTLNEIGPIVRAEVRRIVVLVIDSAKEEVAE